MNRRLPAWIGGSAITVALAVGGFAVVKYFVDRPAPPIRQPSPNDPEADDPHAKPFTLAELEKLDANAGLSVQEVARLLACYKLADEDARLLAELILVKHATLVLDKVRARLRHSDARVRFCAAETLGFMGPEAAAAAKDLVERVNDDDADVRYKAVFALSRLGVRNELVFTGLINALADKDESVRDTVLEVLEAIDTLPPATAPALAELLLMKDAGQDMRSKVLPVLAKTGVAAVPIFRDLLKNIKLNAADPALYWHYLTLIHAADKLEPPHLKALLPELCALLTQANHASQGLEQELADLFKKCGADGAKCLAAELQSVHKELVVHNNRVTLLQTLGAIGPDAAVAVPVLIEVLKTNTPKCFPVEYRPQILETLGDIGLSARAAIPAIEALLKEPALAEDARATLRRLGVIQKAVIE